MGRTNVIGFGGETCECENTSYSPYAWGTHPAKEKDNAYVRDGETIRSDSRKEYQQHRNKSFRRKNKLVLKQNIPYEDMIFPVVKKQVSWDVW